MPDCQTHLLHTSPTHTWLLQLKHADHISQPGEIERRSHLQTVAAFCIGGVAVLQRMSSRLRHRRFSYFFGKYHPE